MSPDPTFLLICFTGALEIATKPVNKTVVQGGSVSLYCNASSTAPVATIKWSKVDDRSINFTSGSSLVLTNVKLRDGGLYECEARNGIAKPVTARAMVLVSRKSLI